MRFAPRPTIEEPAAIALRWLAKARPEAYRATGEVLFALMEGTQEGDTFAAKLRAEHRARWGEPPPLYPE